MKIIHIKHNAFTMMEAIMAMIIILTCFSLFTMTYLNILHSDNKIETAKAYSEIKFLVSVTERDKAYFDSETEKNGLRLIKTITPYGESPELRIMQICVLGRSGKKLAEHKSIIIIK